MRKQVFTLLGILSLVLLLPGCKGSDTQEAAPVGESNVFRPPPAAPQTPLVVLPPTPTFTSPPPQEIRTTSAPSCVSYLSFLGDLTIPDGTLVEPGTAIDKRWQVQNSGSCNWDERFRLRLIEGPNMGASSEQALFPARSGTQAIIRIIFTAPNEPGVYRSAWQAFDPNGEPFGDLIFIQIVVQ